MPLLILSCKYCGHTWKEHIYSNTEIESIPCAKCGDRKLSYKEITDTDPFGYDGKRKKDAYLDD